MMLRGSRKRPAVFRTDYMDRLRSLLRSLGESGTPPEAGRASTPKSVRRLHRSSQPKRLFPEAGDDGLFLTVQNPAEMVGETVIDCRPSVLPVSIPLSGLSPDTVSGARRCVSYQPSEKTGQSIMDMDTNEITINRIVGFEWDEAGTDLEDEMPTPVLSPTQIVVPVIPPAGTADPFGRGDGFDRRGIRSRKSRDLHGYRGSCRYQRLFWKEVGGGAMCADANDVGPDLSREGPFDACEAEHEPGQSPLVLDSMPGCQYRMTSYDDRANRDDLDPAYGIHLHDPHMMEYMGASESARRLGRTPEYWLEHMGRERTVQAALRLHHDASLIMTNVHILSQLVTSFNRMASEVMRTV